MFDLPADALSEILRQTGFFRYVVLINGTEIKKSTTDICNCSSTMSLMKILAFLKAHNSSQKNTSRVRSCKKIKRARRKVKINFEARNYVEPHLLDIRLCPHFYYY